MDFYSIWPFFACLAGLVGLASMPVFAAADAPPSQGGHRLLTVDGLRGFLALAVVFHHVATYHGYLLDGRWQVEPATFYASLGPMGVAMFFMVTGCLFWSQLVREGGRPAWVKLYIGRVFRIGPLYLVAVALMLAGVAVETGLRLQVTVPQLAAQIGPWLGLGLLPRPDVNGYAGTERLLAGVTWTLQYEWLFYACLPLLALVARRPGWHLRATVLGLALCIIWVSLAWHSRQGLPPAMTCAALFLSGMTCASLRHSGLAARLPDRVASVLVLALLAVAFWAYPTVYAAGPTILMGIAFYLIASGCTVFGLLVSRPALRLGNVSYGIYLLQGLALAVMFRPPPLRGFALASPLQHWTLALVSAALLVAGATLAHALVERPGIALGRRVARRLGTTLRRMGAAGQELREIS